MTEDLVNALKELVRCYEECNNRSVLSDEITMWRKRFINCKISEKLPDKRILIKEIFLSIPSDCLMKTTPEEYFNQIIDGLDEK
jgi:hypothetical protein